MGDKSIKLLITVLTLVLCSSIGAYALFKGVSRIDFNGLHWGMIAFLVLTFVFSLVFANNERKKIVATFNKHTED